jgi:DNA-binding NarL/FixJ family response regulator
MIRIMIADDHTIVRRGLKQILSDQGDMGVIAEAKAGVEVVPLVRKISLDVLVLDISMPGRGGLEILKDVKEERPHLPVLVLSMHPEDQYAVRALRLGASGYLTKEAVPEELVKAIRKIAAGGRYITPSLAEKLAVAVGTPGGRPVHESLSEREYQVMQMLAAGKSVSEIAEELSLSVKTISTYRSRLLEKMCMKTNADVIRYAIQNQLTP